MTVTAVLIAVAVGFYRIYHLANSGLEFTATEHDFHDDTSLSAEGIEDIENFILKKLKNINF